jgi:hypothetical protein
MPGLKAAVFVLHGVSTDQKYFKCGTHLIGIKICKSEYKKRRKELTDWKQTGSSEAMPPRKQTREI